MNGIYLQFLYKPKKSINMKYAIETMIKCHHLFCSALCIIYSNKTYTIQIMVCRLYYATSALTLYQAISVYSTHSHTDTDTDRQTDTHLIEISGAAKLSSE